MTTDLVTDLAYGVRKLRRSPLFATVAIATLAGAIAATTTIFSFVNAVWLRPLPYPDAERIAAIGEERRAYWQFSNVGPGATTALLRPSAVFERVSAYQTRQVRMMLGDAVLSLRGLAVDTGFRAMLRLQPQLGRFLSHDEIFGGARVAVISDTLWRSAFGSDTAVLRRALTIDGERYPIIGVLQPAFRYPWQTDVWIPLPPRTSQLADANTVTLIAKRRPGITRDAAQAELNLVTSQLSMADSAGNAGMRLVLRDEMLDRRANSFMPLPSVFMAAALVLLLVAGTNVASLFLARAADRRMEMAVRGSLGASRLRLARQLMTEGLVVATLAAALGTLLSAWLVRICLSLIPTRGFPSWIRFDLDVRVLGVSVLLAFIAAIVVGLAPAREGTRFDLAGALKQGGGGITGRAGVRRGRRRGVVLQVAMAILLFVAAGLFVRSHDRLARVDLGYPAEQVASVSLFYDRAVLPDAESQMRFVEELLPRIAAVPMAKIVTARGSYMEPRSADIDRTQRSSASGGSDVRIFVDGDTTLSRSRGINRRLFVVADGYFEAVGLRVLRGRVFAPDEGAGSAPVVVVSRRFAEQMIPGDNPLGRTLQVGATGGRYTIIGVVDDVRDLQGNRGGVRSEPRADAYFSSRQARANQYAILARAESQSAAEALHGTIASVARQASPTLIVGNERTLANQIDEMSMVTRVFGWLLGALALAALLLAIVGLYGVIAYDVTNRTREVGIRMALGGTAARIVGMIVREGVGFVGAGLVLGLLLAAALTRVIGSLLFGVSPLDPATYLIASALFAVVAVLACYLPARRASRVNPLEALRAE